MSCPRPCRICRIRPVAHKSVFWCYGCHPDGPREPPPCRRCGRRDNYYSAGLCGGCHQYAPQARGSCRDCLAWGATRTHKWRCRACEGWLRTRTVEVCRSCRRSLPVKGGVCRLCWRHAESQHPARQPVDLLEANRLGQQLFLADVQHLAGARTAASPPRDGSRRSPVDRRQLQLFDPACPIPHPRLAELEQAARDHAAAHGWSESARSRLLTGLRKVLTVHAADRQVAASAAVALLGAQHVAQRHTLELLAAAGMLIEDRTPALEVWFERQLDGLPA